MLRTEFRIFLPHLTEYFAIAFGPECNWNLAALQFQRDLSRVRQPAGPQRHGRPQSRMPGEWQFLARGKYPHQYSSLSLNCRFPGKYKSRLRQIGLARNRRHVDIRQPTRIGEN